MMQNLPDPLSRKDLQQLTRERLIFAARTVFAADGYHGARLDKIATEAGFSKGAVYSNFKGKAELFLAVMDENMQASLDDPDAPTDSSIESLLNDDAHFDQAVRGFALATLEFIATAARDQELRAECAKRIDLAVGGYSAMAESMGASSSDLTAKEMGALFFALDQGAAIMSLAGSSSIRERTLNKGLAALLGLRQTDATDFRYDEVRKNIAPNLASGHPTATSKPDAND